MESYFQKAELELDELLPFLKFPLKGTAENRYLSASSALLPVLGSIAITFVVICAFGRKRCLPDGLNHIQFRMLVGFMFWVVAYDILLKAYTAIDESKTGIPIEPVSVYKYTRNPLCSCLLFLFLPGLAILTDSTWMWIIPIPLAFVYMEFYRLPQEESLLLESFKGVSSSPEQAGGASEMQLSSSTTSGEQILSLHSKYEEYLKMVPRYVKPNKVMAAIVWGLANVENYAHENYANQVLKHMKDTNQTHDQAYAEIQANLQRKKDALAAKEEQEKAAAAAQKAAAGYKEQKRQEEIRKRKAAQQQNTEL